MKQKQRKRGGKIGILDRDKPRQIIFISPIKIAAIRARWQKEEAQKITAKEKKKCERETRITEKARKT